MTTLDPEPGPSRTRSPGKHGLGYGLAKPRKKRLSDDGPEPEADGEGAALLGQAAENGEEAFRRGSVSRTLFF